MKRKRTATGRLLSAGLTGVLVFMALPVLAVSPRLDNANAHLVKAAALLRAAGIVGESRKARAHRERAIKLIERAEQEIVRSKQVVSKGSTTSVLRRVPSKANAGSGLRHK